MTARDGEERIEAPVASRPPAVSPPSERDQDDRPAGIRRSTAYSPELESLRGWAMLLVFVFHAEAVFTGTRFVGTTVSPWLSFITAGHTGVTLFFVLSAFLLSRPFLDAGRGGRPVRHIDFFRRRVLRIMPLYTAAVLTATFFCFQKPGALMEAVRALFFVNSYMGEFQYHRLAPYSNVWWSLGTEAQFYLALPILGLCFRSTAGRIAGALALIGWAALYGFAVSDRAFMMSEQGLRFSLGLPGRTPAFLAGIAAAWIVSRHGERIRTACRESVWLRRGGSDLLLVSTLLALGYILQHVTFLGFMKAERQWPIWHLGESALWALVVLIVVLAPIRTRAVISNRALATCGLLSYSLYLVHIPIIMFVILRLPDQGVSMRNDVLLRIAMIFGLFAICLALSALTYRFIERPFLLRKSRIDG